MDKEKIEKIMRGLHEIGTKCDYNDYQLAVYIYMRLGKFQFDNYIDGEDLEQISGAIQNQSSLFNEDLNDFVSSIL